VPSPDPRAACRGLCAALIAVCLLAGAPPAQGQAQGRSADEKRLEEERQDKERRAREAAERAAEQQRLAEEAGKREQQLRRERRDAVQREQKHAGEIGRIEAEIARLGEDGKAKHAALQRRAAGRQEVLAALVRMAGNEPAFLVALPGRPLDNVQGALAFRAMEQELKRQSDLLAAALDELKRVREGAEAARLRSEAERAALAAETQRIERMLIESADDQRRAAGERKKLADLADRLRAEARDNEELIAALVKARKVREEAERRAREEEEKKAALAMQPAALPPPAMPAHGIERPKELRPGPPARGGMTNPVAARIVRNFGQTDDSGSASKGVVFGAGARTRVVAPYDGQVVYAGPFRGYGRILIIEHGGGYHTLLSGLGRIDCAVGQWVLAGEPVAVMGEQSGAGLYVELRRDGQPVNPLPWLAAGNG